MSNQTSDINKRIAKNTLLLYFRLILTMGVGLFTSRVVLNTLGVEDYGVYNVVGGVVVMFSLFTGSLSAAISRFLTYELGTRNFKKLSIVFSTSVTIQVVLAIIVSLLAEFIGVWFLNSHMNIPFERMDAANWVLHFSILTFAINLVSVPYNAAIISHEKMSAFAYISILEVFLKLMVAYALYVSPLDKLITYAGLLAAVALIVRFSYSLYCSKHFEECHYTFIFDKKIFKAMTGFAGWNLFGTGAYLFNTQGVNIVTNIFFDVTANAARGVANQAEGIIKQFVTSFTTAINPQIMKSYAAGNLQYTYSLVCQGAKFSYFLMLLFVVPFIFETEIIMEIWLKNYPPEAPLFLRLSMVGTMFDMLGNSMANAAMATGNVKRYYLYVATIGCLVFPLSWIAFLLGCPAYTSYIIFAAIYFIVIFVKLWILNGLIGFPKMLFMRDVILRVVVVTAISFVVPYVIYQIMYDNFIWHFTLISISCISAGVSVYIFGLANNEQKTLNKLIKSKIEYLIHK